MTNEALVALQDQWIATRSSSLMTQLFQELVPIAEILIKAQLGRTKKTLSPATITDKAKDAVTRLLTHLLVHVDEGWRVDFFRARLQFDVLVVLSYKHDQPDPIVPRTMNKDWEDFVLIQEAPTPTDDRSPWDLLTSSEYKNEVMLGALYSRSYKAFILQLDKVVPRQWIYNHAVPLNSFYKTTKSIKKRAKRRGYYE